LASDTSLTSFLLLVLHVLLSSLLAGVHALLVKVVQHVVVSFGSFIDLPRQQCSQSLQLLLTESSSGGHLDMEVNDKVSKVRVGLKEGHSESSNDFSGFVSDDLASGRVNVKYMSVQVLQLKLEANEGLNQ